MNKKEQELIRLLVEKSKEAAYMAVEIMNKPTIHYRTEGFCFFICNAWELLLKAFLIKGKGEDAIFLPTRNETKRTKSITECMDEVFTSTDNPVRSTLSLIVRMRNRATHLVSSSDDKKYAPGFQTCVSHYFSFLKSHFPGMAKTEMTPFISLAVGDPQVGDSILIDPVIEDFFQPEDAQFTPLLKGKLFITKREQDADFVAHIARDGEVGVMKVNVPKDISITHPFTQATAVKQIQQILSANGLDASLFNRHSFGNIKKDYHFEGSEQYCYKDTHYNVPHFYYSQTAIDFIASRFLDDEAFFEKYKAKGKEKPVKRV